MRRTFRWLLPVAVTTAALAWVFSKIDFATVIAQLTPDALAVMVPSLLVFAVVALAIEAECLVRLLPTLRHVFDRATAARIKAASYPLSLVHYALGAGAVAVLLGRRTDRSIADAAGIVGLITLFDLTIQLVLFVVGVTALGTSAPAIRGGVVATLLAAIVLGFVVLRASVSLGPLDRLRELPVFDAARTTPIRMLLALGGLRFVFAMNFVALIGFCCAGFGIDVPTGFLLAAVPLLIVAAMIPSVAGLGTGQIAFVEVFGRFGDDETLLACSLAFSTGIIVLRAGMGLAFAREFTREAFEAAREAESG